MTQIIKKSIFTLLILIVSTSAMAFTKPFDFKLQEVNKVSERTKNYYYFTVSRDKYFEGNYFYGVYKTKKVGKDLLRSKLEKRINEKGGITLSKNLYKIPSKTGDYILKTNLWNFKYSITCVKQVPFRELIKFEPESTKPYPIIKKIKDSKVKVSKHKSFDEYTFSYYEGNKKVNKTVKGEFWQIFIKFPKKTGATFFEINKNLVAEAEKTASKTLSGDPTSRGLLYIFDTKNGRYWVKSHAQSSKVQFKIIKEKNFKQTLSMDVDDWESDFKKTGKITLKGVEFEFNKSKLKADSEPVLDKAYALLKKFPGLVIEVGGHTDNIGNKKYNRKLSQKRAEAVKGYLVKKGIKTTRLIARGYGDEKPVASNKKEEGRAKNRRVELVKIKNTQKTVFGDFDSVFKPFPGSQLLRETYPENEFKVVINKDGVKKDLSLNGKRKRMIFHVFNSKGKLRKELSHTEMKENYIKEVQRQGGKILEESKYGLLYKFDNDTGSAWVKIHTTGYKYAVDIIFTK